MLLFCLRWPTCPRTFPVVALKVLHPRKPLNSSVLLSVQFSSVAQSCWTLCDPTDCSMPGFPGMVHHQIPEFSQTHVHQVSDAIQPSHPLSPFPSTLNLSQHQALCKWVSSSYQVAKGLELQPQHQCFQWTPRTDLLRMDWLDLFAVQGTLKTLLQHHNSKASILWCSAFFMVQLSHPYDYWENHSSD